jgi:hypothetical protein
MFGIMAIISLWMMFLGWLAGNPNTLYLSWAAFAMCVLCVLSIARR